MSSQTKNQYVPNTASAPGETLQEVLEDRGMTQQELAERLGMAPKTVNEIIKGKAPLTHDTALAMERVLGISAGFWNRMEAAYQESLARQRDRARLEKAQEWLKGFPVAEMVAKNFVARRADAVAQAEELLRFLRVASPVEWKLRTAVVQGYFRHCRTQESDVNTLGAWLQRGENLARATECAPYDAARFTETLHAIRRLTVESQSVFLPRLSAMCQECGVAVALVPALPKARVCGFTRWLSPIKALLLLSDRYKRADVFWFTFYHEAGHILKHGKKEAFLELETGRDTDAKEQEADRFAADLLLPSALFKRIAADRPYSRDKIVAWADRAGVAPGIVVGRLHHEKLLPQSHLNDLRTPIDLTAVAAAVPNESVPLATLAETFAGRVGGLHGGGTAWSEDTGRAFAEAVGRKQATEQGTGR